MNRAFPQLEDYIQNAIGKTDQLSDSRKKILNELSTYISNYDGVAQLNFICTHNSRRSHFGQVWAQVMAYYHEVDIRTFSGGTEATAFNPRSVAALIRAGFEIIKRDETDNPRYEVKFSEGISAMECFSKVYDHDVNPRSGFAAVMTCSEADEACPLVIGAQSRIRLLYEDPKVADDTPSEERAYDERCLQIATEMAYVMKGV